MACYYSSQGYAHLHNSTAALRQPQLAFLSLTALQKLLGRGLNIMEPTKRGALEGQGIIRSRYCVTLH